MTSHTSTSTVTFSYPFALPDYSNVFPAGTYEMTAEDELLTNLGFAAYRRTATHIQLEGADGTGQTELRPIDQHDLDLVFSQDQFRLNQRNNSEAALSPQEVNK